MPTPKRRHAWKAKGLCSQCGGIREDITKKTCGSCRKKYRRKQELRVFWREQGLCSRCGKKRDDLPKITCKACRERDKRKRDRYEARKRAAGLCSRNGCENPALYGYVNCEQCRGRQQAARIKRVEKGLCTYCFEPASEGFKTCFVHREKTKQSTQVWRAKQLREGRCVICGINPPKDGTQRCEPCGSDQNEYRMNLQRERAKQGLCPYCGKRTRKGKYRCKMCSRRHNARGRKRRRRNRNLRGQLKSMESLLENPLEQRKPWEKTDD